MKRLRAGVVGCGMVSQLMHLPYLRELSDRYELAAICDLSPGTLELVGDAYGIARRSTDWRDLLDGDLDALFVLTNGSHAAPAIAAAERGLHVFVEKPLCWTLDEADKMIAAAEGAGTTLMVGYMKRYDPGFELAQRRLGAMRDVRFLRLTTLEAPADDYVAPYPILRSADVPAAVLDRMAAERASLVRSAIGDGAGRDLERAYIEVLLDSAIHELNMLRGLVGEPVTVSAELWDGAHSMHAVFGFPGELRAALSWLTLPGLRRYKQEIACYAPDERLTIEFPSPYLRNAPTPLILEEQDAESTWQRELVTSFDEAFRRELIHFHECATSGEAPRTTAADARRDIALAQAIVRSAIDGRPVAFDVARADTTTAEGDGLVGSAFRAGTGAGA